MSQLRLGMRANAGQFSLLVLVNAFVGAMVGMERSILPAIAEDEMQLSAHLAILTFIAVFGFTKALANYVAGRLSDTHGRRVILIGGWLVATPVPFLLMWAPSWGWILVANALLGVSQGLTWSTTVIMKIDLAGPARRGLAMGVNELAGYIAVAVGALATGWLADAYGLRPQPFYLGVGFVLAGLVLSLVLVRETRDHAKLEARTAGHEEGTGLSAREIFWRTSVHDRDLSSACQAGMVNNLNDGMAWGLFPLVFAASGLGVQQIGWLAAIYPAVWGLGQLPAGALSDRIGRKPLIVAGMFVQALALVVMAVSETFSGFAAASALLGVGTAMVYPTLLAAVGDAARPSWRATAVGVYRLWRDLGYVAGALVAGVVADIAGLSAAVGVVAGLTLASGVVAAARMNRVPPVAVCREVGSSDAQSLALS